MQNQIVVEDTPTSRPEIRLYYTLMGRTLAYTIESRSPFSVEMRYENRAGMEALEVLPLEEGYFCAFILWCDVEVYIKYGLMTFVISGAGSHKEAAR